MDKVISLRKHELDKEVEDIYNLLSESSPLASVVLCISFIDKYLDISLRKRFIKSKTTDKILQNSFKFKCDLAYCLNLISKIEYQDLNTLGEIRNRFAHEYPSINFNDAKIIKLTNRLKSPDCFLDSLKDENEKEDFKKIFRKYLRSKVNITAMYIIDSLIDEIDE